MNEISAFLGDRQGKLKGVEKAKDEASEKSAIEHRTAKHSLFEVGPGLQQGTSWKRGSRRDWQ